ncbi:MAG TPA: hypothetical protein VFN28_16615 [Amaricoccus sp.]|nr:hypothetical protein [Amaricoccus sp.]
MPPVADSVGPAPGPAPGLVAGAGLGVHRVEAGERRAAGASAPAWASGVAALVTDGPVRDIEGVLATALPVWCRGAAAPPSVGDHLVPGQQGVGHAFLRQVLKRKCSTSPSCTR